MTYSLNKAAPNVKIDIYDQIKTTIESMKVTIYTSDECPFCEPAIDTVHKAIDGLFSMNHKPQIVVSRIDTKTSYSSDKHILALPTIAIGRYKLVGLPRVEEVEHLLHCAIMEVSF
jgi:glutaredoxin